MRYFNHAYGRTGTLWEGRYKATLIDAEAYLFTCMRYIEMNPVRTGMVSQPEDYLGRVTARTHRGKRRTGSPPIACTGAWAKQQPNGWQRIDSFFSRRFRGRFGIDPGGDEQGVGIGQ